MLCLRFQPLIFCRIEAYVPELPAISPNNQHAIGSLHVQLFHSLAVVYHIWDKILTFKQPGSFFRGAEMWVYQVFGVGPQVTTPEP